MLSRFKEYINATQFNAIKLGLASTEQIKSLSYGEVKKTETINYRTLKPEKDGLFCARIFGPVKDWECNCGKYKRMKHRGITCEKCGVEVIQARVRRERMGHIDLVAPVCHIWFLKGIPSYLGMLMDVSVKDLERVIYFDAYMVVHQGKSPYARKTVLTQSEYESYRDNHSDDTDFIAKTGAEAISSVLALVDLQEELKFLEKEYKETSSVTTKHKIIRRIKIISGFIHAGQIPDLMILKVLPVLPPDLRPLVPLEGGRFASSDLNELYRRVLNRNIRLKRLMEIEAPEVIIKNEKRMLQESVDALIDNGRRGQPVRGSNKRPLKSLSDMLRGKQGRFRQNLLGKRVDYSGRSVIVVDPELNLNQCGLPKSMALEIFKPFVLAELIKREIAPNLRMARKMVDSLEPEVWDALEDIVSKRAVLLNRAPTLHRLGIQSFYPILVDGKAIKIHPLVCPAFNADFDGDTMSVHVPLSKKALEESIALTLSSNNLLSPSNGKPITVPNQDMVLGLHYMTKARANVKGENIIFSNIDEVVYAYQSGQAVLHAQVKLRLESGKIVNTTVGRVLLYVALPKGSDFSWINQVMRKSDIAKVIDKIYKQFGNEETVLTLDRIKKLGFQFSTWGGISFSIDNLVEPDKKEQLLDKAEKEVQKVEQLYMDGAITNGERSNKVISVWGKVTNDIAKNMMNNLEAQNKEAYENKDGSSLPFNSVYMMLESGAKGSTEQIKQFVGIRGLMAKPSGEIMETPVKGNFKRGLSVFEYFISTSGARKGQADTALKTANSGYLTRRLVDVAQDVVISLHDCNTLGYIIAKEVREGGVLISTLNDEAYGRVAAADLKDEITGQLILEKGELIDENTLKKIEDTNLSKILVRSVLTCQSKRGVCALCYGMDLSKGKLVDIGTAVGIIAAQSIGEPGTQLTMRTFHIGGTASIAEEGITTAMSDGKVEFRNAVIVKNRDNKNIVISRKAKLILLAEDGTVIQEHDLEYGTEVFVQDNQQVKKGEKLAESDPNNKVLLTAKSGKIEYVDMIVNVTMQEAYDEATGAVNKIVLEHKGDKYQPAIAVLDDNDNEVAHYYLPSGSYIVVDSGQRVSVGDILAKIPREASKTKDITGSLPRIAELFEARAPKDPAVISDIDGEIEVGGIHRGQRKITVTSGDEAIEYLVPQGKQLNVSTGELVKAGDLLTSGEPVLHDMLRILGPDKLQSYLVKQIQTIYRIGGININDRHVEVIVKQMLRKVRIVDSGDSDFLIGDRVDKIHFKMVNAALQADAKKVATAKPILMGITMASLGTESFISAASFQETTRILAEAAISGEVDHLYGLKENVIIGKLILAGTGIKSFREKYLGRDLSELEKQAEVEEKQIVTGA
ncbi:DNA-directed RNA polymerase subunit beta' [candidate division TM6 bacterium RIFCSPHIGHO2_12_FULL_32_22]|nr:MAG: DNA-directed RNA polymerase subunit beta' [candidate division TM6 bacterium RIFCSPHIGHO2_12_FULL_32_22]